MWRRKKTEIEWQYIGNEIGETEGKEGKIMERERKEIEEEIGKCKLRAGGAKQTETRDRTKIQKKG